MKPFRILSLDSQGVKKIAYKPAVCIVSTLLPNLSIPDALSSIWFHFFSVVEDITVLSAKVDPPPQLINVGSSRSSDFFFNCTQDLRASSLTP